MQVIQPPWENRFLSKVQAVEKCLFISSPYIKDPVATSLCEILQSKQDTNVSVQILTRFRTQDLIDGASDLEAFEKLLQLAEEPGLKITVKCISNLHAKVYIFDENSAIVTSSNLTRSGLNNNIECGIKVTEQAVIQRILGDMHAYWSDSNSKTLTIECLEATKSAVMEDRERKRSLCETPSVSVSQFGKRVSPRGQDIEFTELVPKLKSAEQLYVAYWKAFMAQLTQRSSKFKPRSTAQKTHFVDFGSGTAGIRFEASTSKNKKYICVGLCLWNNRAKERYKRLEKDKANIEKAINTKLKWTDDPKQKQTRIDLYPCKTCPEDRGDWDRQHRWLCDKLELFYKVFKPRIDALKKEKIGDA